MTNLSVVNVKVRDYTKETATSWEMRRELQRDQSRKPRIYFSPVRETIVDNFQARWSRPYNEYRKLLPQVLEQAGISLQYVKKIRWSQKAGCSCGCSPGFVVDDVRGMLRGRDVFVNVAPQQPSLCS